MRKSELGGIVLSSCTSSQHSSSERALCRFHVSSVRANRAKHAWPTGSRSMSRNASQSSSRTTPLRRDRLVSEKRRVDRVVDRVMRALHPRGERVGRTERGEAVATVLARSGRWEMAARNSLILQSSCSVSKAVRQNREKNLSSSLAGDADAA